MSTSALRSAAHGGSITIIGQLAKVLINFISLVVLSRLLPPEDFGLVAMVTVVISLGDLLRDFGLSTAGLGARQLSNAQASNLFWYNTALGGLAAAIVAALTPFLVRIYDEPRLAMITPVLAVTLLLNGIQAQLQVQMSRKQRYTAISVTEVASQAAGLSVAVVGAMIGWGYWALVAQTVTASALMLVLRLVVLRWRPSWFRRGVGSKALLIDGADYGIAYGLTFAANNTDTLMIGALWGATPLGLYNRAYQLLTMPITSLLTPLMRVVVPTINQVKNEGGNPQDAYIRIQSVIGIFSSLVFAVAAGSANSLIPLALGSQWIASIPLFQILALGGFALGLSQVSYWIFVTEGKSRELLKYNLVTKTLTVALVVGGAFVSVEGAAWAYSLALLISWPINVLWLGHTAGIDARRFLTNGLRVIGAGMFAMVATMLIPLARLGLGLVSAFVLQVLLASTIFFLALVSTRQGRADVRSIVDTFMRLKRG